MRVETEVLGAHPHHHGPVGGPGSRRRQRGGQRQPGRTHLHHGPGGSTASRAVAGARSVAVVVAVAVAADEVSVEEVHGRVADEARHEHVGGPVVDLGGRAHLLEHPGDHHGDAVAHGHGLDLIVGHVHHGGLEAALQVDELGTRLHPELGVKVGQGLVHQEHRGATHDGPGQRDPLALSARELGRPTIEELLEAEHPARLGHGRVSFVLRDPTVAQRELDVPAHGHVRVERVALEHHGHVSVAGLDVGDVGAGDGHGARVGHVEPGDHAQRGGLAASRRPEQHEELPVGHVQIQAVHRDDVTKALGDATEDHRSLTGRSAHGYPLAAHPVSRPGQMPVRLGPEVPTDRGPSPGPAPVEVRPAAGSPRRGRCRSPPRAVRVDGGGASSDCRAGRGRWPRSATRPQPVRDGARPGGLGG